MWVLMEEIIIEWMYAKTAHVGLSAIKPTNDRKVLDMIATVMNFRSAYWRWVRDTKPTWWQTRFTEG